MAAARGSALWLYRCWCRLGRTEEPKLGGGLERQIPGHLRTLRTAASLLSVGIVRVLHGIQAAAALEGDDGVRG